MTNIKKRHFCKSVALLSLVPLLKINFLSANTNVQNSVLSGSVIINGKKVSKNSDLDFDQITDVETGNQLSLIKNDQDGFLVRPNSKLVFYKNKNLFHRFTNRYCIRHFKSKFPSFYKGFKMCYLRIFICNNMIQQTI